MMNLNGFIVWMLVYIMTIWQYIAIISLPMHCVGYNQISISNSPNAFRHTCVLWYGELTCWGEDDYGQLGQGSDTDYWYPPPDPISLNSDFIPIEIVMGEYHSCSLSVDGRVACWGDNEYGQLGLGHTSIIGNSSSEMGDALQDTDLGTNFVATQLVAGGDHNCALSDDSRVKCWGYNNNGQLGLGDNATRGDESNDMGDYLDAVQFGDNFTPIDLTAGLFFNCALSLENAIKCWGENKYYQIGDGTNQDRGDDSNEMGNALATVDFGSTFIPVDVAAGAEHVCAISQTKEVKCWGFDYYGQLGMGCGWTQQFGDNLTALDFADGLIPDMMALGWDHSCFASTNGSVVCFGRNNNGQLGYGDTNDRGGCDSGYEQISNLSPVDLGADFRVAQMMGLYFRTCALSFNDELKCWGYNNHGQLGYNDSSNRGDSNDEMGDNLQVISIPFTANPTTDGTADPTTVPTIDPTMSPTSDPTIEPTSNPTSLPSEQPSFSPSTETPTVIPTSPSRTPTETPTTAPTSTCDPIQNCSQCLFMNPDNRTLCLWHSAQNKCYFRADLQNFDENVIVDEAACHIGDPTNVPTADPTSDTTSDMFPWIMVILVIAIVIVAFIVVFILRRRNRLRSEATSSLSNVIEMQVAASHEDQNGSQDMQPGEDKLAEPEPSIIALPRVQTSRSRGEGIEAEEGNNTVTKNAGDV